ncbi:UNVERIFIED_CONTAM: protein phosphatase 1 regulatory inhibitor subunit PPP1R8 [Sesamum angustifolium]|uniref:Protein phosphatase 1 regulatory inhibitor subunit PPP1R8 n=1 Tax=Sesamum angustifolium TaxID=2727405 RepID=A0AAW2KWB0_9LAMI
MYGRAGLDRFKKAQSLEPFSVTDNSATKSATPPVFGGPAYSTAASVTQAHGSYPQSQYLNNQNVVQKTLAPDVAPATVATQQVTQVGGGQSTWQPPDWAIEPRPGVYYLEVVKEGEVLDQINLDKRRHIFGRQFHACEFVLDHQSVSRQHAAVVPHKNGSSFPSPRKPTEIDLPPPPDPSDEEAVLAYNTYINCTLNGLKRPNTLYDSTGSLDMKSTERAPKRIRRTKVAFKDQVGGELVEIVGFSDGADVETEPGPVGVKEGSLVGKYESLVQITVIPKGKEQSSVKEAVVPQAGVTEKLKQVLDKVKSPAKSGGIYDDLYGESFANKVGSSWAYTSVESGGREASPAKTGGNTPGIEHEKSESNSGNNEDDNDDDLFG